MTPLMGRLDFMIIWTVRFLEGFFVAFLFMYYAFKNFMGFSKDKKYMLAYAIINLILSLIFMFYAILFLLLTVQVEEVARTVWLSNEIVPIVLSIMSILKYRKTKREESHKKTKCKLYLIGTIVYTSITILEVIFITIALICGWF